VKPIEAKNVIKSPDSAFGDLRRSSFVRLQFATELSFAMRRNQTSASGNGERGLTAWSGSSSCEIRAPKAHSTVDVTRISEDKPAGG